MLWLKAPGNTDHTSGAIVVASAASTDVLPASSMRIPSCAASGCAGTSKDRKAIANYWHAYILIGVSKLAKNRIDAAIQALESAVQHGVRDAIALAYLGMTYALSRRFSEAKAIFDELNVLARENRPRTLRGFILASLKWVRLSNGWKKLSKKKTVW